jgi:predicted GIY-YIG superfamily endonuclease
MAGVLTAMPEGEKRELLDWEKTHLGTPAMIGTDDWPGWKKYIGDPPALPEDSPEDYAGNIYVISTNDGRYKIGRTQDIERRLRTFRSLIEFDLVHSFPADDYVRAESLLHRHFSEKRLKGEWFELNHNDVELICRLSRFEAGEFLGDVSILGTPQKRLEATDERRR